jgi:hypothetical protein
MLTFLPMKKLSIRVFILFLLLGTGQAQRSSEKLDKLKEILVSKIGGSMPGWTHHSVTPIEGSKNVIVDQWEAGNVIVSVAVNEYDNEESAVAALKDLRKRLKSEQDATAAKRKTNFRIIKDDLPDLGDGGFIWDIMGSDAAAFRKKNFLAFVSVVGPREYNDSVLSRLFAQHVAEALTAL